MFSSFLKVSFRFLLKHPSYTLISILSLSVSICICLLISFLVTYELGFDKHHAHHNDIHRITLEKGIGDVNQSLATTPYPLAGHLMSEIADIKAVARIRHAAEAVVLPEQSTNRFSEPKMYFADQSLFEVFSFDIFSGRAENLLDAPFSAVISDQAALRYFQTTEAIGRSITVHHNGFKHDLQVTGIFRQSPEQSHIRPEVLVHLNNVPDFSEVPKWTQSWYDEQYWTYVLWKNPENAEEALANLIAKHYPKEQVDKAVKLHVQALSDIHLGSQLVNEASINSDPSDLYFFSAVALVILLVSAFNFINMSMSQMAGRLKEAGIRKVLGASRNSLTLQQLTEAMVLSFVSGGLALLLAMVSYPKLTLLTGYHFAPADAIPVEVILGFPLALFLIGLLAGLSPSLYLSTVKSVEVLKSRYAPGGGKSKVRALFVGVQMCVSMALLVITIGMREQLDFLLSKDLGFDQDQIILLNTGDTELEKNYEVFRNTLLNHSNIQAVGGGFAPGFENNNYPVRPKGNDINKTIIPALKADAHYLETINVPVVAGRAFRPGQAKGRSTYFYLNEQAAALLGWTVEEAIGKQLDFGYNWYYHGEVAGVIADFNFSPLTNKIEPLIVWQRSTDHLGQVAVKLAGEDIQSTLEFLENTWQTLEPVRPFAFSFLDEDIAQSYARFQQLRSLASALTLIAVLIASIGLIGLTAYQTSRRLKEVGIRKVLGASRKQIAFLFYKSMVSVGTLAIFIAQPISILALNKWLDQFAYTASLGLVNLLVPPLVLMAVLLLSVSSLVLRTAAVNPIKYLADD